MKKEFLNNIFLNRFIPISKYSYSIYVVHFPIIIFINYIPFRGNIISLKMIHIELFH